MHSKKSFLRFFFLKGGETTGKNLFLNGKLCAVILKHACAVRVCKPSITDSIARSFLPTDVQTDSVQERNNQKSKFGSICTFITIFLTCTCVCS